MTFKEEGYQIIRGFLEPDFVKFINQYFFTRINAGKVKIGDKVTGKSMNIAKLNSKK